MYPRVFLETFWRMELRPQIFVAMSFDPRYDARYKEIIAPVISSINVNNVALTPYRVDLSKSGDSILTDIMDGIAHSRMVLADVSTIGVDRKTKQPYRNGNVMYEVGLALACRQSSEVLLIRDDRDIFLFDLSTIPHMTIDFHDKVKATTELQEALMSRLKEQNLIHDARVQTAVASLSKEEVRVLKHLSEFSIGSIHGWSNEIDLISMIAIPRLLDKQILKCVGEIQQEGLTAYTLTPLGRTVAQFAKTSLQQYPSNDSNATTSQLNRDQELSN